MCPPVPPAAISTRIRYLKSNRECCEMFKSTPTANSVGTSDEPP